MSQSGSSKNVKVIEELRYGFQNFFDTKKNCFCTVLKF